MAIYFDMRESFYEDRRSFYESREWKELRYRVLKNHNGRCCLCGRTASHGIILHVDHILPKSKYPSFA